MDWNLNKTFELLFINIFIWTANIKYTVNNESWLPAAFIVSCIDKKPGPSDVISAWRLEENAFRQAKESQISQPRSLETIRESQIELLGNWNVKSSENERNHLLSKTITALAESEENSCTDFSVLQDTFASLSS